MPRSLLFSAASLTISYLRRVRWSPSHPSDRPNEVNWTPFATPSRNDRYLRTPAVHHSVIRTAKLRPTAVGPDPNALIRIRDRYAANGEALAPERVGVFVRIIIVSRN